MTLRHMTIFCALCENENNTTKAAEKLNMTQPAVSLAIKELEQYYGIVLYDRLGKRLHITDAGVRLYEYASHIISLFHDMELGFRNWDSIGRIRVGSAITIGTNLLPQYIKSFRRIYPEADVRVTIAPSEILESRILSSDLDFAFTEGFVHSAEVISENYLDDRLIIICSKDSEYENGRILTHDEFKNEHFLLREKHSASRKLFDTVTMQAGFSITPIWEAMSTTAIINGVINNFGISVIPYRLARNALVRGDIREIYAEGLSFERHFSLIYHKDKFITPAVKSFIDIAKNHECNFEQI